MLKNNILKILCMIIVIVSIIFSLSNTILAINPDDYEPTMQDSVELNTKAGQILGIVSIIGTILSVIIIMIIGIRYMVGSLEEKAEYKKTMATYLIGAVLLFSATVLPTILYNIGNSMFSEQEAEVDPNYTRPGNIKPGGIIKDEVK